MQSHPDAENLPIPQRLAILGEGMLLLPAVAGVVDASALRLHVHGHTRARQLASRFHRR